MAARDALTRNQLWVLERLEASTGPLSAYTLLDQLAREGFRAPLQVYRALDTLIKGGFVHRLESLNAFVACAEEPHDHSIHDMTAFAICDRCGQVVEMSDHEVGEQLDQWVAVGGLCGEAGRHRVPRHLRRSALPRPPEPSRLSGRRPAEPDRHAGKQAPTASAGRSSRGAGR